MVYGVWCTNKLLKMEENGTIIQDKYRSKWKTMNLKEKCKHITANITIEPILAAYILPNTLAALATQNLYLEKACRLNLNYSDKVCTEIIRGNGSIYLTEEMNSAELVVYMGVWKTYLSCSLPVFLVLFLGSWSDRHARRKPFILMPLLGDIFTTLTLLASTYFFHELPMEITGVFEALFPALAGGMSMMIMAIFSYIADITSIETRTLRIGIANIFVSACALLGGALSGILLRLVGYYGVFSVALAMNIMGFIYCLLKVKEVKPPIPSPVGVAFLRDLFDISHVKETFRVGFKKREGNCRQLIVLLLVLDILLGGPIFGESQLGYYFTRVRLNWNEVDFSLYATYGGIVGLVGTTVGIALLVKYLKLVDGLVGFIGCISQIIAKFVYAFGTVTWLFYLGPLIEIFGGVTMIAMRSIVSKLVPTTDIGQLNSLFGVCDALTPILYSTVYNTVYANTQETLIGTIYIMSAILMTPPAIIFMLIYKMENREKKNIASGQNQALETFKQTSKNEFQPKSYHKNEAFEDDQKE